MLEQFHLDKSYISSKEEQLLKRKLILVIYVIPIIKIRNFFREIQSLNIDFILVILP